MTIGLPITPALGSPIPNVRHAISVQLPTWDDIKEMFTGEARVKNLLQTGYPRSFIHKDIKKLNRRFLEEYATPSTTCYIFSNLEHARKCLNFITDLSLPTKDILAPHLVCLRSINVVINGDQEINSDEVINLHAVFCPADRTQLPAEFWRLVGTGISSRLAEYCVNHMKSMHNVTGVVQDSRSLGRFSDPNHRMICQRIVDLTERASIVTPDSRASLTKEDVYLYQTGMSAIYHAQELLNICIGGQSVQFGFPYELTLKLLETFGPPVKFYPFGSSDELIDLEMFLEAEHYAGRIVQAIWCECASNPLLRTPNLGRLRELADKHHIAIVVDNTIGSFANVDLMNVADIIVTSLTKSFSGYADVMMGSIILNPVSPFYSTLKKMLAKSYVNCVFKGDTFQMEKNSQDFLQRTSQTNETASYLVHSLSAYISSPKSGVTAICYPEVCWTTNYFRSQMRLPTKEFTPGFGGLFTLQFESVEFASTFFNELNVHKGPSLGASVTLVQPYVQTVFQHQKEWAASCGLHESIVRVSVGLEDREALLMAFKKALSTAEKEKTRKSNAVMN